MLVLNMHNCAMVNTERSHVAATPNSREYSTPYVQNGKDRRTYPAPNRVPRQAMVYSQCSEAPCGSLCRFQQRKADLETYLHEQRTPFLPTSEISLETQGNRRILKANEIGLREHNDELLNPARASVERDKNAEDYSSNSKRLGETKKILRGRKGKMSTFKSEFDETNRNTGKRKKKIKKKKSNHASSSLTRCDTGSKGVTVETIKRMRRAPLRVSMKDKTKKWESVAVKGKASYLRKRSQRMLKDRMSKYRLVDSKGVVVEGKTEEEPCTSSKMSRLPSSGSIETSVSPHNPHIFGINPEVVSKSHRKRCDDEVSVSFVPSAVTPSTSTTFCRGGFHVYSEVDPCEMTLNSSSGYASLPNNLPNLQPSKTTGDSSSTMDNSRMKFGAVRCSSGTLSANSSIAAETRSLSSRDLTTLPNVTNPSEVLTVKEEPTESPPPDALPSPLRFDQTVSCPATTSEGNISGEKERQEFWLLGIAELKKGHEILATKLKIENLQKDLFQAASELSKMEFEMNEILRRKSELLGIPAPNVFL